MVATAQNLSLALTLQHLTPEPQLIAPALEKPSPQNRIDLRYEESSQREFILAIGGFAVRQQGEPCIELLPASFAVSRKS